MLTSVTDDEIFIQALWRLATRYRATALRQTNPVLRAGFEQYARQCRQIALRARNARGPVQRRRGRDPRQYGVQTAHARDKSVERVFEQSNSIRTRTQER
jgi:hypothetical protein